jgi:hypothetical protein
MKELNENKTKFVFIGGDDSFVLDLDIGLSQLKNEMMEFLDKYNNEVLIHCKREW